MNSSLVSFGKLRHRQLCRQGQSTIPRMAQTPSCAYASKLLLFYALLLVDITLGALACVDLGFNGSPGAWLAPAAAQTLFALVVLSAIAATLPFQLGQLQYLTRQRSFLTTAAAIPAYAIVSAVAAAAGDGESTSGQRKAVATGLALASRLIALIYYLTLTRTMTEAGEMRFYVPASWMPPLRHPRHEIGGAGPTAGGLQTA